VFADTDTDLNISVEDVGNKITPKTKAIVFVHFGGNNRGLKEIIALGEKHNIKVIEDAAQAVGSDYWGKADYTCVSLQAIKTLTCGDGGFLICRSNDDHIKAKRLRWFGYDRDLKQKLGDTDLTEAGYKYHMNDISAAIGRGNLSAADQLISHRKKMMARYNEHPNIKASIWLAVVTGISIKNGILEYLEEHNIGTGQYHFRNDKYTVFGGRQRLPTMDRIEDEYFLLPAHQNVSLGDVDYILKTLDGWKKLAKNNNSTS
jgi:dTDP-4-amino-4,6-dideoxygalactose transaminase